MKDELDESDLPSPCFANWSRGERRSELGWIMLTGLVVAVISAIPPLFFARFYFADDTQAGAWPMWVTLGESLLDGRLPLLSPSAWMAGNLPAEGQWGLLNPMVWAIAIFASLVPSGVVATAIVKVSFLALAAGGVFVLARSFGANRPWAFAAGLLASSTGFTVYIDAASWVTALMVWALLPWAWWAIRGMSLARKSPLGAFVLSYFLITVGYVHGTIFLVVALISVIIETVLARDRRASLRAIGIGVLLAMVATATYLPGVLAARVTARQGFAVVNSNFMSPDLSGLAMSSIPTGQPPLSGFWSIPVGAPLLYIAWILPVVAMIDVGRARRMTRSLSGLLVMGGFSAAMVLGVSDLGPLRFPARMLPYLSLCMLVGVAVLISRAQGAWTRSCSTTVVVLAVTGGGFAFAETPQAVLIVLLGAVVSGSLAWLVAWSLGRLSLSSLRLAALIGTGTLIVAVMQHAIFPKPPLSDFALPSDRSSYSKLASSANGDLIVVGDVIMDPESLGVTSFANGWLLADVPAANVYSAIAHEDFAADLCMDSHGPVCSRGLENLFALDSRSGLPVVDLLSISSIQILSRDAEGVPVAPEADPYTTATVPAGWVEVERDDVAAMWVRVEPVAGAGGVVWTSGDVELTGMKADDTHVSFVPQGMGADGTSVVFSRINWPGVTVDNGSIAAPTRGYLVTIDIPASSEGKEVRVDFTPAGWRLGLKLLSLSLTGLVLWAGLERLLRTRNRTLMSG